MNSLTRNWLIIIAVAILWTLARASGSLPHWFHPDRWLTFAFLAAIVWVVWQRYGGRSPRLPRPNRPPRARRRLTCPRCGSRAELISRQFRGSQTETILTCTNPDCGYRLGM